MEKKKKLRGSKLCVMMARGNHNGKVKCVNINIRNLFVKFNVLYRREGIFNFPHLSVVPRRMLVSQVSVSPE